MESPPRRDRPPRLVRLARILKRVSIVVFILFILYLATVAYSFGAVAKDIGQSGGSNRGTAEFTGTSTIATSHVLNVSNPGFYSLGLGARLVISTSSGLVLGEGSTPSTDVSRGGSGQLLLTASISVAPGSPGQALLTNSETLQLGIWVNVSLGFVLVMPVSVHIVQNDSWGAPFAGGAVTANVAGGQASLTFAFQNNASFNLAGLLEFEVLTPGGASCGSGSFGMSTPSGQSFDQSTTFSTSCASLAGDQFDATLSGGSGSPYSVQLPMYTVEG